MVSLFCTSVFSRHIYIYTIICIRFLKKRGKHFMFHARSTAAIVRAIISLRSARLQLKKKKKEKRNIVSFENIQKYICSRAN